MLGHHKAEGEERASENLAAKKARKPSQGFIIHVSVVGWRLKLLQESVQTIPFFFLVLRKGGGCCCLLVNFISTEE